MSLHRIQEMLSQFNRIGYTKDGMNRMAYTDSERKAKEFFKEICESENVSVRMDHAGNMIAYREGLDPTLPPVLTGSHLDTVTNGGKYDGVVGVVAAIELIRRLNEQQIRTNHPIEVIGFAAEESSRFGIATIGSKGMAGILEPCNVKNLKDKNNVSLETAFSQAGLNLSHAEGASRENEDIKAFFEVHIEQGPVLEREQLDIGVVTGIAAPTRLKVTVEGKASHSGTTPMDLRKDAFLGAAEIGIAVEKAAIAEADKGTVATVGECTIAPGAMNIVPELAEMQIDIRSVDMNSKQNVLKHVEKVIKNVETKRGLLVHSELLTNDEPVILEENVTSSILRTCKQLGVSYREMPSGAGHDAMNMAKLCPTGLIFIPCRDGLSHHKDEFSSLDAIGIACDVLEKEILKWAIPVK
ncbi:M20 family metallo-hydrolase [Oceanobacillus timonensis]|uniref:M20 family metallo-hydrolase n=1 Tax=Oceanobacillus timonensis TaxID=1926285 RepID=UPI001FE350C9|nr:M20 family metallo-hydrolase [Oceanobacillus timonensis]